MSLTRRVPVCVCVCLCMSVYIYVCIYVCVYLYVLVCVSVCARARGWGAGTTRILISIPFGPIHLPVEAQPKPRPWLKAPHHINLHGLVEKPVPRPASLRTLATLLASYMYAPESKYHLSRNHPPSPPASARFSHALLLCILPRVLPAQHPLGSSSISMLHLRRTPPFDFLKAWPPWAWWMDGSINGTLPLITHICRGHFHFVNLYFSSSPFLRRQKKRNWAAPSL